MNMLSRFGQRAALCALLLGFSLTPAGADEMQDANRLFKQGQHTQALEMVDAFLARKPKDATARFLKGLIRTEQGNSDEAIRIFTALTEDYPELPEPYNNLAVLYAGQGQYEKARVALEMAIRTHPNYATAHENLGDIYAKMASQSYERALQFDRSNPSAQAKLALIRGLFKNTRNSGKIDNSGDMAGMAVPQASAPAAVSPDTTPSNPAAASTSATAASAAAAISAPPAGSAAAPPGALPEAGTGSPATSAASNQEVLKAVHDWADAWSANDVPKFLAFYAKDFKVPKSQSRSDWEQERYRLIAKPKSIKVSIAAGTVRPADDNHATVTFRLNYRSGTLKTSTLKTLEMVKLNGTWQILEERTGR